MKLEPLIFKCKSEEKKRLYKSIRSEIGTVPVCQCHSWAITDSSVIEASGHWTGRLTMTVKSDGLKRKLADPFR
jgi:hypothetical protein